MNNSRSKHDENMFHLNPDQEINIFIGNLQNRVYRAQQNKCCGGGFSGNSAYSNYYGGGMRGSSGSESSSGRTTVGTYVRGSDGIISGLQRY
jgi:hypothetical protein